ncbi:MAG: UDP-N-acetylmuramoyl-tripeptide--D-alanyl-D-alanine ligase [Microcoleaceae cyanobacterium]
MSNALTPTDLAQILTTPLWHGCENQGVTPITGITTDSRHLKPGEVFLALSGERFDGHKFVEMALAAGAVCAIVESDFAATHPQLPLLAVEDTLAAYQAIAHWWRQQFNIPIIGVTGSVGKTTTKELIAAVLSTQGNVLKTEANYNNEIGVPKTLLQLCDTHDYAVVEMAMRAPGEIALLSQIAAPTIGLIINVGTAHIGRLGSEQAIAEAKCELLAEMPGDAVAILNHDNSRLIQTAATVWSGKTLTYGLESGDLTGELIDSQTLRVEGINLNLPLPGSHNALNFLAALAVWKIIQGETTTPEILYQPLKTGLNVVLPAGRAKRYDLDNDIVILDETYNAGLESMKAALQLLVETPGKRHIAVLGTMKELGEKSVDFHHQIGQLTNELNLDALFILAETPEATAIATGADGLSIIKTIDIASKAADKILTQQLIEFIKPGDRLLFKASHSVGLNKVVEQLRTAI